MRKFRTEIEFPDFPFKIGHADAFFAAGSCFADVVAGFLHNYKFTVCANPYGVLYNPISIHESFGEISLHETWLVQHQERWLHYGLHSQINAASKKELTDKIVQTNQTVQQKLRESNVFLLTYGTAWVYMLNATGNVVANCHKQPAHIFSKRLLTLEEIIQSFGEFLNHINKYGDKQILLTVSPVRHTKDTLMLNQAGKSLLRYACHVLSETHKNVYYFPAYEILMDDLRDYRFYKSDLIHPTPDAEEYVWEVFSSSLFTEKSQQFIKEWQSVWQAMQHRPFNVDSKAHQTFIQLQIEKLKKWETEYDVKKEIDFFASQLINVL